MLVPLILRWISTDKYILCIDRTNWKYGKKVRVSYFFRHVEFNQRETWCSQRIIDGVACAATRSVKELVVVGSTEKPKSIITDYRKRWCIETLFGCLKSSGFDIESTHMTIPERMDKHGYSCISFFYGVFQLVIYILVVLNSCH